jgi:hypothetical protein
MEGIKAAARIGRIQVCMLIVHGNACMQWVFEGKESMTFVGASTIWLVILQIFFNVLRNMRWYTLFRSIDKQCVISCICKKWSQNCSFLHRLAHNMIANPYSHLLWCVKSFSVCKKCGIWLQDSFIGLVYFGGAHAYYYIYILGLYNQRRLLCRRQLVILQQHQCRENVSRILESVQWRGPPQPKSKPSCGSEKRMWSQEHTIDKDPMWQ